MTISEISVQDLAALGATAKVIDVRERDEWDDGHIPHAVHVALGTVPDNVDAFDGQPTYVVCLVGGRSLRACEYVDAIDGRDVVNVIGGMRAWRDAGLDVAVDAFGADGA